MSEEHAPVGQWPRELTLDQQLGPAPYLTRVKADALIFAALEQAGFAESEHAEVAGSDGASPRPSSAPAPTPAAEAPALPARRKTRGWLATRSLAAAAALLACVGVGSASAAVYLYVREQAAPVAAPAPVVSAVPAKPKPVRRTRPEVVAPAASTDLPPITIEVEREKPERHAPEDLLIEGNRHRAERRWAKADEAYTRAFQLSPRSQAAYVARVASAAVRLEHLNDPSGALTRYRAALRQLPEGPLGEEILFGIAEAHRALDQHEAEREALQRFLQRYPSSALAKQAQARLE